MGIEQNAYQVRKIIPTRDNARAHILENILKGVHKQETVPRDTIPREF